jgi:hypothetical protein
MPDNLSHFSILFPDVFDVDRLSSPPAPLSRRGTVLLSMIQNRILGCSGFGRYFLKTMEGVLIPTPGNHPNTR